MIDTTPSIVGDVRWWLVLQRIEQEETAHHIDPESTQPRTKRQKSDSSEEQSCPQPQTSEEETLSDAASKWVLKYLSKGGGKKLLKKAIVKAAEQKREQEVKNNMEGSNESEDSDGDEAE